VVVDLRGRLNEFVLGGVDEPNFVCYEKNKIKKDTVINCIGKKQWCGNSDPVTDKLKGILML